LRNRYVLLLDLVAFALAVCGAFALRFDLYFFLTRPEFAVYVRAAPIIKTLVFVAVGMDRRFWRYASVNDLLALCLANSVASVATSAFVGLGIYRGFIYEFSRSVLFADWLLSLALTAAIRLSILVLNDARQQSTSKTPSHKDVLVIGAGDPGILVAREMQRNTHLGMKVVGFLDDDPVKLGGSMVPECMARPPSCPASFKRLAVPKS
jgi:FlaA1/EpsC-like NDP-sugar epimerase